jgi:branched-chain amino acid transport system ATP-binding protein
MEVLHGVDLTVQPGEIVAIIGPNGSGKSTVLKSIFNLCKIYSGKIEYKDKDITNLPTHDLILEGIGFVPQGRLVFSDLTVLENLQMGAYAVRDQKVVKRNLDEVFSKFPILEQKKNELAGALSGGQQQLLAIARALIQNPQFLLMDEPSLGLSPKAMGEVFRKIKEISQEGISVMIVEQNVKQVLKIANRVYVLEAGEITLTDQADKVSQDKLAKVYFGT